MAKKRVITLAAGSRDIEAHLRVSATTAITEVVFNAIDADAKQIDISLARDLPGGPVVHATVSDNGHGVSRETIDEAFGTHRDSPKRRTRVSPDGRPMQGQQGRGRFRALAIASSIEWVTTAENGIGELETTRIRIFRTSSTSVDVSEIENRESKGTVVSLSITQEQKAAKVGDPDFRRLLEASLAPVLLSTDCLVTLDGEELDPASQVDHQASFDLDIDLSDFAKFDGSPAGTVTLEVIEWQQDTAGRTAYLCDEHGAALGELETRRLPKAPALTWTAYVRWEGFGREETTEGDLQSANSSFRPVVDEAIRILRKHLEDRSDEISGDLVEEWIGDGSYPYSEPPTTIADTAEQETFRELVGIARKALPEEHTARKLALGMMKAAFQESPDDALSVIEQVKNLDEDEVRDFRQLLERTPLSQVVRASKAVSDRVVFLVALKELLYGPDFQKKFLERDHLHKLLDKNPWVFGNEWGLVRSEASLNTVLKEHLSKLRPDAETLDASEGDRRIDMLLAASSREHLRTRRLVVELKRASNKLGRDERDQIEDYARALSGSARFAGEVVTWDFWLIGTEIKDSISGSLRERDKPQGLFQELELEGGSSYRIWIKSWSEVIAAAEESIEFFRSELDFDPGALESIEMLRQLYPENIPLAPVTED